MGAARELIRLYRQAVAKETNKAVEGELFKRHPKQRKQKSRDKIRARRDVRKAIAKLSKRANRIKAA